MSYKNEINQYCINNNKIGIKETIIHKAEVNSQIAGYSLKEIEFMSLPEMFNWQESKEGYDYWCRIYKG